MQDSNDLLYKFAKTYHSVAIQPSHNINEKIIIYKDKKNSEQQFFQEQKIRNFRIIQDLEDELSF